MRPALIGFKVAGGKPGKTQSQQQEQETDMLKLEESSGVVLLSHESRTVVRNSLGEDMGYLTEDVDGGVQIVVWQGRLTVIHDSADDYAE